MLIYGFDLRVEFVRVCMLVRREMSKKNFFLKLDMEIWRKLIFLLFPILRENQFFMFFLIDSNLEVDDSGFFCVFRGGYGA